MILYFQISVVYKNGTKIDKYGLCYDHNPNPDNDYWYKRYITIEPSDQFFRISFKVFVGSYGRTVRIDNVEVNQGECDLPCEL